MEILSPKHYAYRMFTGHNVSQIMVEQWWNNITYNLTDFAKSVTVIAVNTKLDIDLKNHNDYQTSDAIVTEELSSSLGKCFIFKPLVKFEVRCARHWRAELVTTSKTSVLTIVSFQPQSSISMFVTNEGSEIGLQSNYWPVDVFYDLIQSQPGQVLSETSVLLTNYKKAFIFF